MTQRKDYPQYPESRAEPGAENAGKFQLIARLKKISRHVFARKPGAGRREAFFSEPGDAGTDANNDASRRSIQVMARPY